MILRLLKLMRRILVGKLTDKQRSALVDTLESVATKTIASAAEGLVRGATKR